MNFSRLKAWKAAFGYFIIQKEGFGDLYCTAGILQHRQRDLNRCVR